MPATATGCPKECPCGGSGWLRVLGRTTDHSDGRSTLIRPATPAEGGVMTRCPWREVAALRAEIVSDHAMLEGAVKALERMKARTEAAGAALVPEPDCECTACGMARAMVSSWDDPDPCICSMCEARAALAKKEG